jgi:hypothetical protein
MPRRPITFAIRALHYGRYGRDAEHDQLVNLYAGYPELVHGYGLGSFTTSECSAVQLANCGAVTNLIGSRLFVANFEVRAPLVGLFRHEIDYGKLPVEVAAFYDAGVAWTRAETPSILGGTRDFARSFGGVVRVNAFGILVIEVSAAKPLDRLDKGVRWQIGIRQGF